MLPDYLINQHGMASVEHPRSACRCLFLGRTLFLFLGIVHSNHEARLTQNRYLEWQAREEQRYLSMPLERQTQSLIKLGPGWRIFGCPHLLDRKSTPKAHLQLHADTDATAANRFLQRTQGLNTLLNVTDLTSVLEEVEKWSLLDDHCLCALV